MDLYYQFVVLVVDLLLVRAIRRKPAEAHGRRFVSGLVLGLGAAFLMGAADPFHVMRLAAWLLFVHVPVVAAVVAILVWDFRRTVGICCGICGMVLCAVGEYAFMIEPYALEVSRYTIHAPGAPEALRIAVIADLQTDAIGRYEYEALTQVMQQDPDVILWAGDYLQMPSAEYAAGSNAFRQLLRQTAIGAPLGAFAVRGDAEPRHGWTALFDGTDVTTLDGTQSVRLNDWLTITGLDLQDSFDPELRLGRPGAGFHLVFGHRPDFALGEIDADLLVAGHTHGGQVQLPFFGPLLTMSRVPRNWASGRTRLDDDTTLIVSSGMGMERNLAPRLRFLCPPEIVIVDVVPAP